MKAPKNQGLKCRCKLFSSQNEQESQIIYDKSKIFSTNASQRMINSLDSKKKSLKKYRQNISTTKIEKNGIKYASQVKIIPTMQKNINSQHYNQNKKQLISFTTNKNNKQLASNETFISTYRKIQNQSNKTKIYFNKAILPVQSKSSFFDDSYSIINKPLQNFTFQSFRYNNDDKNEFQQNKTFKPDEKRENQNNNSYQNQQNSFSISYPTFQFWEIINNSVQDQQQIKKKSENLLKN